jgi:phosphate transport system permease protein
VLTGGLRAAAAVSGAMALLIAAFLVLESLPVLRKAGIARFFLDASWHPTEGLYNLAPMLGGTLLAAAGSLLVATPLGILSAVFCRCYAPPPAARLYRRLLELLAGIPSVVYGLWGLTVLVPWIARLHPPGPSLLGGIAVLAIMILPTIALSADAAIAGVSPDLWRGAAALGLSRGSAVRGVVLPAARSGLFTGILLGAGRSIGETMAVLMVCGNQIGVPRSLFDPVRTLTANIALEMAYATGDHRSALFVSGLILLVLAVVLVGAAEGIGRGRVHV